LSEAATICCNAERAPLLYFVEGLLMKTSVRLRAHEERTIAFLRECGYRVRPLPRSSLEGVKSADIYMGDKMWEMKAPRVGTFRALQHLFKKALHQSVNVIFDLRELEGRSDERQVSILIGIFTNSRAARHFWVITKKRRLVKMYKADNKVIIEK